MRNFQHWTDTLNRLKSEQHFHSSKNILPAHKVIAEYLQLFKNWYLNESKSYMNEICRRQWQIYDSDSFVNWCVFIMSNKLCNLTSYYHHMHNIPYHIISFITHNISYLRIAAAATNMNIDLIGDIDKDIEITEVDSNLKRCHTISPLSRGPKHCFGSLKTNNDKSSIERLPPLPKHLMYGLIVWNLQLNWIGCGILSE